MMTIPQSFAEGRQLTARDIRLLKNLQLIENRRLVFEMLNRRKTELSQADEEFIDRNMYRCTVNDSFCRKGGELLNLSDRQVAWMLDIYRKVYKDNPPIDPKFLK